jgi:hypothetical protein
VGPRDLTGAYELSLPERKIWDRYLTGVYELSLSGRKIWDPDILLECMNCRYQVGKYGTQISYRSVRIVTTRSVNMGSRHLSGVYELSLPGRKIWDPDILTEGMNCHYQVGKYGTQTSYWSV